MTAQTLAIIVQMCIRDRLYSAVCTTYDSYKELLDQLEEEVSMGRDAAAAQRAVSYTHLDVYKRQC